MRRPAMINTLRGRLTLWYVAFFSLLLLLFSLFLHGVVARALERRLDESLSGVADTAAALLTDEFGEMKGDASLAASEVLGDLRLNGSTVAFLFGKSVLGASAPLLSGELVAIAGRARGRQVLPVPQAGPHGAHAAV